MREEIIEPIFENWQEESKNELILMYDKQQDELQEKIKQITEEFEEVRNILPSMHNLDIFVKEQIIRTYQNAVDIRLEMFEEFERKIEFIKGE